MFENVPLSPPDPILGLSDAFAKDTRPDKINLTIGVYQDDQGRTPVLRCVKLAEQALLETEQTKGYLGIDGLAAFRQQAIQLALSGVVPENQVVAVQTPGGTGALRVAADLIRKNQGPVRIWVSTPTWPNHVGIFESAGLEVKSYPYLTADKKDLDLDAMMLVLQSEARRGDILCLHGCCHNPSGIDPTAQQWSQIAELSAQKAKLQQIDFAYHGYGEGLEEDRVGVKAIGALHPEFLLCSSFSKNFGLYSERVGALLVACAQPQYVPNVASSAKQVVRTSYSNPPRHGGAVITTILADEKLRTLWNQELAEMRQRIHAMRIQFVEGMKSAGASTDFSFLLKQRGMFSFSGLTALQVDWLRSEKGVYLVGSGRINVAGITSGNLPALTSAIAQALRL